MKLRSYHGYHCTDIFLYGPYEREIDLKSTYARTYVMVGSRDGSRTRKKVGARSFLRSKRDWVRSDGYRSFLQRTFNTRKETKQHTNKSTGIDISMEPIWCLWFYTHKDRKRECSDLEGNMGEAVSIGRGAQTQWIDRFFHLG